MIYFYRYLHRSKNWKYYLFHFRVCFTLNLKPENRSEGIISLRTAGDISLPRDRSRKGATSTMRGLIVPQGHNNPPAIIPLTHSRASRESGDYASSDVQVSSHKVFPIERYQIYNFIKTINGVNLKTQYWIILYTILYNTNHCFNV